MARIRMTPAQLRGFLRPGGGNEEITWAIAQISIEAKKEGWGAAAIARFIGCSRYSVYYHVRDHVWTNE